MSSYKEVFQLAQDKGWEPETFLRSKNSDLLYLTLIQKWLRDEQKIDINIRSWAKEAGSEEIIYDWAIYKKDIEESENDIVHSTYEEALLSAVSEALKEIK